jgi:hypothetical protein
MTGAIKPVHRKREGVCHPLALTPLMSKAETDPTEQCTECGNWMLDIYVEDGLCRECQEGQPRWLW